MRLGSSGIFHNRLYFGAHCKFSVSIYTTVGCPLETDPLWQIIWPNTPPNVTRIQRCPEELDWIGNRVSVYFFLFKFYILAEIQK